MDRVFPKPRADEIGMLTGCLDWQRATVRLKAEGLNDRDAYRKLVATSPKMTIAGVVSHLRWTEWGWFSRSFPSVAGPALVPPSDESGWDVLDRPPLELLVLHYEQQCDLSRQVVAALDLDDVQEFTPEGYTPVTLRWIVTHMIDETARHLGHLDFMREMLDGTKGY